MRRSAFLLAFLLALPLLAGCAAFFEDDVVFDDAAQQAANAEKDIQEFYQALQQSIDKAPQAKTARKKKKRARTLTRYVDEVWLGDRPKFFMRGQQNLPDKIKRQRGLVFVSAVDLDIRLIASRISEMTGIPVQVRGSHIRNIKLIKRARLNYRGSLIGLLNVVANSFEASWSYDVKSRSLMFTRLMTRAFNFYAPPDETAFATPVVKTGEAKPRFLKAEAWRRIKRILTDVMPSGSRANISPEAGKITVTTTPPAMERVAQLIRVHNQYFTREVHLNVQVISFDLKDDLGAANRRRLNLPTLLKAAGLDSQKMPTDKSEDKKKLSQIELMNVDIGLIIAALRKIGKVSVLTITDTQTRDGKVTPISMTSQQAYLPRPEEVSTNETNAPTTITTGFSMRVRPRILPRARVQLDMSMSLRVLDQIKSLGADNNRVQIPEISTNSWAQETIIPNRATLLVAGFEHGGQKVGAARNQNALRALMIVLITPTIIEQTNAEEVSGAAG